MGAIVIDEGEILNVMKKLKIEVTGGGDAFKLYNTSDIASKENKIHVMLLKYKHADL
jgi:hypothetical protein